MDFAIVKDAITIIVDMRNSSNLIKDENDVQFAEKIILEFNDLIYKAKGYPIFSKSTGDGYILIYEAKKFVSSYEKINKLIIDISLYIGSLMKVYPDLKLGYGIGMQKSQVKIIKFETDIHNSEFLIGQSINTASKYAYYHNRTTLGHYEFLFDGILTTATMNSFLIKEGFEKLEQCKESSGIKGYRMNLLKRSSTS